MEFVSRWGTLLLGKSRTMAGVAAILITFLAVFSTTASAAGPEDEIRAANALIQNAIASLETGDVATAKSQYTSYENTWFNIEDGVRERSRASYVAIERRMDEVSGAFGRSDKDGTLAALRALDTEHKNFISGVPPATQTQARSLDGDESPTVSTLLRYLEGSRKAAQAGNFAAAAKEFDEFKETWPEVEGEIKTRSAGDYRATEEDMARVSTMLSRESPESISALEAMSERLRPYENAGNYRAFDATIIVLREGLEALLVVVALLAFLKRSGNGEKASYIWGGATFGVAASIVLGVAIHLLFGKAFSGEDRELMEGATGLIAAAMLLYVSYWLHSQSSIGAWQRYIRERTTAALATGSLFGLGALSFLAVFREGGETVLFLIGMTGKISTGDLLLGLAIGAVFLLVVGVLLTVAGIRIPMRPFFAVASVLTFYLCFKFVGTGIHALQVADVLPALTEDLLPSNDTLGLYPTWQTTIPQIVLLLGGLAIFLRTRIEDRIVRLRTSHQITATE